MWSYMEVGQASRTICSGVFVKGSRERVFVSSGRMTASSSTLAQIEDWLEWGLASKILPLEREMAREWRGWEGRMS